MADAFELAREATALVKNPAYVAAMSGVKDALVARIEDCPIADTVLQHEIALSLQLLKQIDRHIRSYIATGELEQKREEQKQNWLKRRMNKVGAF